MKINQCIKLFCVLVALYISTNALPPLKVTNNYSFAAKEFQANLTFFTTHIKKKVLLYALHDTLTDFLTELLVLIQFKETPMLEEDLNVLIESIDFGDFTLDELFSFRTEMIELINKIPAIYNETHLRTHIIHDIKTIFSYLENEYQIFKEDIYQLEDRFAFECRMRRASSQVGIILEIQHIFYFWFQALVFHPEQEINEAVLRRSVFDRLVLERPHWMCYFKCHPVANLDLSVYQNL